MPAETDSPIGVKFAVQFCLSRESNNLVTILRSRGGKKPALTSVLYQDSEIAGFLVALSTEQERRQFGSRLFP
jgi:hypothetical protein